MKELIEKIQLSLVKLNAHLELKSSTELFAGDQHKDLACYYKLPMYFLEAGKPELAKETLNFIYNKFLMSDGDFRTRDDLKSEKPEYIEFWTYFNGWILRAANLLGHEIPSSAQTYFHSMYLGQGKFFPHHPKDIVDGTTDVLTIAHHGLFYLESGLDALSQEASESLRMTFDQQPDLNTRFLLRLNNEDQCITEFSADAQMLFSVERNRGANQLYFMTAYPCAFLALHHRKTGDKTSLDYARRYMDFMLNCDENMYTSRFSHKTAWAASILYVETREERYLNVVQKIMDFFISIQSEDGVWFKDEGACVYLDQSAEIGCWMSQILKNIKSYQLKTELDDGLRIFVTQPPIAVTKTQEEDLNAAPPQSPNL